jgi:hypothetical protein
MVVYYNLLLKVKAGLAEAKLSSVDPDLAGYKLFRLNSFANVLE